MQLSARVPFANGQLTDVAEGLDFQSVPKRTCGKKERCVWRSSSCFTCHAESRLEFCDCLRRFFEMFSIVAFLSLKTFTA